MICKFCGNSIEDNSDFCFICGQKVEAAEPAFQPEASNDVFSQAAASVVEAPVAAPAAAPAEALVAEAPAAPAEAPVEVEAPVAEKGKKKKAKKAKKEKAEKDSSQASKALKFFTALFLAVLLAVPAFLWKTISLVFIVPIIIYAVLDKKSYDKAKELGYEEKAAAILNSTGLGACVGLALVCIKFFMVAYF